MEPHNAATPKTEHMAALGRSGSLLLARVVPFVATIGEIIEMKWPVAMGVFAFGFRPDIVKFFQIYLLHVGQSVIVTWQDG